MKRIGVFELRLALVVSAIVVVVMLAVQEYLVAAIVTAVAAFGTTGQVRHGSNPMPRARPHDDEVNRDE